MIELLLAPVRWFEGLAAATQDRLIGLGMALPTGVLLVVARSLDPDPAGMGTHKQLGLGGCAMLTGTGVPCPMCGMTTTFAHLADLHLVEGTLNQPFGLVLFLGTVFSFALGTSDLLMPRGRWRKVLAVVDRHEALVAGGLLVGLVAGWAYKIVASGFLEPTFLS